MDEWIVVVTGSGRVGAITYAEGPHRITFEWELGGRDVIATGPSRHAWESDLPWAIGRRREILERVAAEAIRVKAPTASAEFTDDDTTIVLQRPN